MIVIANSLEEVVLVFMEAFRRVAAQGLPVGPDQTSPIAAGRNRSVREAAQESGVSVSTVRRRIQTGEIRAVRIGQRVLIPATELVRLRTPGSPSP